MALVLLAPSPNASLYVASKHAVEGLTKSAALEVAGSGVRVNAIAPGPVETELLDRFLGSPERKATMAAAVPMKRVEKSTRNRRRDRFRVVGEGELHHGSDYQSKRRPDCRLTPTRVPSNIFGDLIRRTSAPGPLPTTRAQD